MVHIVAMWDICEDFCLFFNQNLRGKQMNFFFDDWYVSFSFISASLVYHFFVILIQICPFLQYLCLYLCICTNFCIFFIYFRLLPNICVLDHTRFIHSFLPHQQDDFDRRVFVFASMFYPVFFIRSPYLVFSILLCVFVVMASHFVLASRTQT